MFFLSCCTALKIDKKEVMKLWVRQKYPCGTLSYIQLFPPWGYWAPCAVWNNQSLFFLTFSALHLASQAVHTWDVAELLLSYGASVSAADDSGRTPLHSASEANAPYTASCLLKNGNFNQIDALLSRGRMDIKFDWGMSYLTLTLPSSSRGNPTTRRKLHNRVNDLQFLTRILKLQGIFFWPKKRDENDVQKV